MSAVREPAFTGTMQIGIVVRDLEATMQRYVDDFGIGPWEIFEFNAGNANDLREYGHRSSAPDDSQQRWSATCSGN